MPVQERLRPHHEDVPAPSRQRLARRRKQEPVVRPESWLADLSAKDRQLVSEHKDLQLLRSVTSPEEHRQLQQAADDDAKG